MHTTPTCRASSGTTLNDLLSPSTSCLQMLFNQWMWGIWLSPRGGTTLCTRHAYSKYIIDNRMFTIQFENGFWSENISLKKILKLNVNLSSCLNLFSIWDLLKCMIAILVYKYCQQYLYKKVYKYCYSLPPKVELYWLWLFFCSVMEF